MENKTTSSEVATIASRIMSGATVTDEELKSVAGSVLSQTESELAKVQGEFSEMVGRAEDDVITIVQLMRNQSVLDIDSRLTSIAATDIEKGFCLLQKAIHSAELQETDDE